MKPSSAIGFLTVYNIAQNRLFNRSGYVPANLVATGLGLAWARRSGMTLDELCLSHADASRGLKFGLVAGTSAVALAVASSDREFLEGPLHDDRLDDVGPGDVWFRLLIRFPLGTALFEEVWFRGILPATLRRANVRRPDLVAGTVFAAWHLIPTTAALNSNPRGRQMSQTQRASVIVGGSVLAGLGGLGFAGLRTASKSLVAPWVAHAVINGLALWSALCRRRLGR